MASAPINSNASAPSVALKGRPESASRASGGASRAESATGAAFRQAMDAASGGVAPNSGLQAQFGSGAPASPLKFSAHAVERMRSRGIGFSPDQLRGIEGAVAKAASKGSKDTLVLAGDNALIVSVKNSTVVTVMDKAAIRDNVFTNIDSTVVI